MRTPPDPFDTPLVIPEKAPAPPAAPPAPDPVSEFEKYDYLPSGIKIRKQEPGDLGGGCCDWGMAEC